MSEQDALERLKQQDPTGLEELMRLYGALVLHVVRQILCSGPTGDIEECATDVWLTVWQKTASYDPERSTLKTWVCMLARHMAIDRLRRRRDPATSALSLDDDRLTTMARELQDIPELLERREDRQSRSRLMNQALGLLTQEDRLLIIRRYYLFEDIVDLARESGVSRAVIDNRLTRCRKRLRTLYLEVSEHES